MASEREILSLQRLAFNASLFSVWVFDFVQDTYIWFNENYVPYYVGKGSWARYLVKRHLRVPHQILIFKQECREAAFAFETYLIKRIGRVELGTEPLMNLTDGGLG
jgi:hypothetical protein